ncbi:MAG: hypothetical protein F6K23_38940 [Okeania sp. SIO2C9]|uniref:AidA/PixA family protein n=1 Tax=Okeania sp. SIO2C9 TaxID=2607791 RepID=UPI0013C1BCB8|nr:AidA/PixA family protein [Okeania sp. SIO2C9]NEQ78447.1 hypothetical protein [Okeania sp. SIO2C9]
MSRGKDIYILMVINGLKLEELYPNPSKDHKHPTQIMTQHRETQYLFGDTDYVSSGQGTPDLAINADVNDNVLWTSTSFSSGNHYGVLIYDIKFVGGTEVIAGLRTKTVKIKGAIPGGKYPNIVPAAFTDISLTEVDGYVDEKGTMNYNINFGLYKLDSSEHKLHGYFVWDPKIIVA